MKKFFLRAYLFEIGIFVVFVVLCLMFGRSQVSSGSSADIQKTIRNISPSVVMIIDQGNVTGAGIVVDGMKWIILTSKHLFSRENGYMIRMEDGQNYAIEKIFPHPVDDLALVQVTTDNSLAQLVPIQIIASWNTLERGDDVLSFWALALNQSLIVSRGILSDTHQRMELRGREDFFLQTDVNAQTGFSGGPLFDRDGQLIGINTAVLGINTSVSWSTPVTQKQVDEMMQF